MTISKAPIVMKQNYSIRGLSFLKMHAFRNCDTVPVFDVEDYHAFNQAVGYSKYINRQYGHIYYRGQGELYDSLIPSLLRHDDRPQERNKRLGEIITSICDDKRLMKELSIDDDKNKRHIIEGMLQQYGIPTRCLDVVDNHWISLWMGQYRYVSLKQRESYSHYEQRHMPLMVSSEDDEALFQYVLLLAVPYGDKKVSNGVYVSKGFITVDLREALPSTFLRPHAQHGLLIKKRVDNEEASDMYDLAGAVTGILRIRIDRVASWLGDGELLTQDNLFPSPAYDHGYDVLLEKASLFPENYNITKFF